MLRGPTKVIPRRTHDGAGHAVGEDAALTVVVEGERDELLVGARTGDMRVGLIAEEVPPQVRQAVVGEVRKRKGCDAVGEAAALTVVVEGERDELLVGARTGDMRVGLIAEE